MIPLTHRPMTIIPIVKIQPIRTIEPMGHITEKGDGPRCSIEQIRHFRDNWEQIVPPKVLRTVKRRRDILHGARSVNMLVGPRYSRPTNDFDVYARGHPHASAKEIEDALDDCVGCDIAHIRRQHIPNVSGTNEAKLSDELYIIVTPNDRTGDVDYMKLPQGIPITRKNGYYHEALTEAHRKAQRGLHQPMRMFKSATDVGRIESYWRDTRRRR